MADSVEKSIKLALQTEIGNFPLPSGWTKAANLSIEGSALTPAIGANTKFITFETRFNTPIRTDLSLKMPPIRRGWISVGVKFPRNNVDIDVIDLVGQIAAFFRAGRPHVYHNSVQVRFDEDPEVVEVPLGSGDTHRHTNVRVNWVSYPQVPA